MDNKKKKAIYNFIENELRTEPFPIYADIQRKVFEIFDEHILPGDISRICAEICKEKNIDLPTQDSYLTVKKREYIKNSALANAAGITDEEVYLLRLKGYPYNTMSRVFFEMNNVLLSSKYFAEKYKHYCLLHNIKPQSKLSKSEEILLEIKKLENNDVERSAFYERMLTEKNGYPRDERIKAISELHDPFKKLKHYDYDDNDDRDDHDER